MTSVVHPAVERARADVAAALAGVDWKARAEAAEAKVAEALQVVATFLAVRGGGLGAEDLAEAVRQVLGREPLPAPEEPPL